MPPEDISDEDTADHQRPEKSEKPGQPSLTPRAAASKAERAERVAAEMRKNLMKRKQQQRDKRGDR